MFDYGARDETNRNAVGRVVFIHLTGHTGPPHLCDGNSSSYLRLTPTVFSSYRVSGGAWKFITPTSLSRKVSRRINRADPFMAGVILAASPPNRRIQTHFIVRVVFVWVIERFTNPCQV